MRTVVDMRFQQQQSEHGRLLSHANSVQQQREKELRSLLRQEKERADSLFEQLQREQAAVKATPPPK